MEERLKEMLEDVRETRNYGFDKKALKSKYGIESNKATEIAHGILTMAMELRKGLECTEIGLKVFSAYWDNPSSPARIRMALAEESVDFILYYKKAITPKVEEFNRKYGAWGRRDNRVDILDKILCERNKANCDGLKDMFAKLMAETTDFQKTYVEHIVNWEMRRFLYFAEYKDLQFTIYQRWEGGRLVKTPVVKKTNTCKVPENFNVRWAYYFNDIKVHSDNFNAEVYKKYVAENAERDFRSNLSLVAERAYKAQMSCEGIKVLFASENDAKAFNMVLTDGIKKMHCRSIFCAEDSVLVTPHWRFIITNLK